LKTLIVAKDSEYWQKPFQWIRELGWETVTKSSYREGVKELERSVDIDVVLVDAGMPEDCGLRLLRNVKNDRRLHWLPFIIVGEQLDAGAVETYALSGARDIVILPTSRDTFEAKLIRAADNGRPTVLVVDDEQPIRELLTDILQLERYRVVAAGSAEEGLSVLDKKRIDVVVSDVMLPGKSGMELMREAKQRSPDLPVILITGCAGQFSPRTAIAQGADGYFAKPFKNIELSFTLRSVLERTRRALAAERPVPLAPD